MTVVVIYLDCQLCVEKGLQQFANLVVTASLIPFSY